MSTTPTMEDVGNAVAELRAEFKSSKRNPEKEAQIHDFLDTVEEKVNQPLTLAVEAAKSQAAELAEIKEQMIAAGETEIKANDRIEALELELAARAAHTTAENPEAYLDSEEYKALQAYCVRGEHSIEPELKQLLRTDINPDGGYLVPVELDSAITKKITEIDPIRSISRVRTISGKSINLPVRDSIPVATYEAETETGTDSTSLYRNENVTPFRQTFTTPITWDMLQDSAFDMNSEIMSDAAEAFAFGEGAAFVVGSGVKEPSGFAVNTSLTTIESGGNPSGYRASGDADEITPAGLILLTGDLKVGYDPVYVLNRRTLAKIRTFRADAVAGGDEASAFLWAPGLNGAVANTLNGFPYVLANSMPDEGTDAFAVAFGDFRRGYTIVDRTGLSVIRDDVTLKKSATVEFTMHRWNTGQVTLLEPLKLLKCEV